MERIIFQRNVLAGFMVTARHTTWYNRMVVHLASCNMCLKRSIQIQISSDKINSRIVLRKLKVHIEKNTHLR